MADIQSGSLSWKLVVAAISDVGRVRENNEDAWVVASLGGDRRNNDSVFDPRRQTVLLAVSDGMGGARGGEIASALVIEALQAALPPAADDWGATVCNSVKRANRPVWELSRQPETYGAGATLTAVIIHRDEAHIAEVGDSRAYLLRDGELRLLTRDQSYVQQLVDGGLLTPVEAEQFPLQNVIVAAMGTQPEVEPEIGDVRLESGDRLLVCTDGLSRELTADQLRHILAESQSPRAACSTLISLANDHGGKDNITVIVAHVVDEVTESVQSPTETHDVTREKARPSPSWLNRMVWGMTVTSFLSDLGHEAQSTLLPSFMSALGLPPAALGAVEGTADAAASFIKLGAGWLSDRTGIRKSFVVGGYLATGLASGIIAMARGFPLVLGGKLFGWLGRGVRGPLRDAMLTDSIPESARGRAFGFHRFGDTLGAIAGPLAAVAFLSLLGGSDTLHATRVAIAWTLVPGVLSAVVFALFVRERARTPAARRSFRHALRGMPREFRRYLAGVGIFGAGDYAHTMLILAATQLLTPRWGSLRAATVGAGLYVLHNAIYAATSYPAGVLADRYGHRKVLALGYAIAVTVPLMLILCYINSAAFSLLVAVFVVAGLVNGIQDTLEGAATGGLVPEADRGLGFGLLGAVNGVGDFASSMIVGLLWTAHPALGFGYAALCMAAGAGVMIVGARVHR